MMDAHSLEVLEFPGVLAQAARHASSARGAEWVRALEPTTDLEEAERRLRLTDELRRLLVSAEGFPTLSVPDVRETLATLNAAGIVLDAPELRDLARVARTARLVRERMKKDEAADFPLAAALASRLVPAPHFERAVEETFDDHGEILDSASGALRSARRHIRQQRERIVQKLESFRKGDAADRTVTLRADRYVLAVRAAEKSEIGGIVHDRSGSGATLYLEPVGLLDENNRLIELMVEEREEIRRILAALSDMVRGLRHDLALDDDILAELDAHRAMARLANAQGAMRPVIVADRSRLRLRAFRHPLLLEVLAGRPGSATPPAAGAIPGPGVEPAGGSPAGAESSGGVVPLDLELTADNRLLLVTGPNMGGKTVALKGVGLACLMAAVGLHLPAADGTEVLLLDTITADIGDEQSIEQDLSTFASHLRRWIEATRVAGPGSLALLDEIGAGTDPAEGSALAQAVLERLADSGGFGVATTHLGALKKFASEHPGIVNGSMRFDPVTERPLYRLDQGLPGQSRAIEMARRLGLDDGLVGRAAELVGREEHDVQALLVQLETARRQVESEQQALLHEKEESSLVRRRYDERLQKLAADYAAVKARAVREGDRILSKAGDILREAEAQARQLRQSADRSDREARQKSDQLRQGIRAAREEIQAALPAVEAPGRAIQAAEARPGGRFWAEPLQAWVTIVAPPDGDKVRVERNGLRVELPLHALRAGVADTSGPAVRRSALDELPPERAARPKGGVAYAAPDQVQAEVDLRGLSAEEALEKLDLFLDGAMLSAAPQIRVIHGKGTGVLREAVRKWLAARTDIVSYRYGEGWEGGTGVTVVHLE